MSTTNNSKDSPVKTDGEKNSVDIGVNRPRASSTNKQQEIVPFNPVNNKLMLCTVRLLDNRLPDLFLSIQRDALGQALLHRVCEELNVVDEMEYFGLRYYDKHNQQQWLELAKGLLKQLKHLSNVVVNFRVKHYPSDPASDIIHNTTRYYIYLQVKRDLLHGRLLPNGNNLYSIAALILQEELASKPEEDKVADEDIPAYLRTNKIIFCQTKRQEENVLEFLDAVRDYSAERAELEMLKLVKELDTYGVEPFNVWDNKNNSLYLGLTHYGIIAYQGDTRLHVFKWSDITKLSNDGKKFEMHVNVQDEPHAFIKKRILPQLTRKTVLSFKCESEHSAKALWKWAVDRQCFFTLENSSRQKKRRSGGGLFHRTHTFQFSGRSQRELMTASQSMSVINEPLVKRASTFKENSSKFGTFGGRPASEVIDYPAIDFSIFPDDKKANNFKTNEQATKTVEELNEEDAGCGVEEDNHHEINKEGKQDNKENVEEVEEEEEEAQRRPGDSPIKSDEQHEEKEGEELEMEEEQIIQRLHLLTQQAIAKPNGSSSSSHTPMGTPKTRVSYSTTDNNKENVDEEITANSLPKKQINGKLSQSSSSSRLHEQNLVNNNEQETKQQPSSAGGHIINNLRSITFILFLFMLSCGFLVSICILLPSVDNTSWSTTNNEDIGSSSSSSSSSISSSIIENIISHPTIQQIHNFAWIRSARQQFILPFWRAVWRWWQP